MGGGVGSPNIGAKRPPPLIRPHKGEGVDWGCGGRGSPHLALRADSCGAWARMQFEVSVLCGGGPRDGSRLKAGMTSGLGGVLGCPLEGEEPPPNLPLKGEGPSGGWDWIVPCTEGVLLPLQGEVGWVGLDGGLATERHLPLDGGGWEGVWDARILGLDVPPPLDPSPQGGGVSD